MVAIQASDIAASQQALIDAHVDVTGAAHVQVTTNEDKTVLWVNVNGVCLLRICRIEHYEES